MKKSNIAMIVLISGISILIASVVASNLSFLKIPDKGETVKDAKIISADPGEPDEEVFNKTSINPTVQIFIGSKGAGDSD